VAREKVLGGKKHSKGGLDEGKIPLEEEGTKACLDGFECWSLLNIQVNSYSICF